MRLTALLPPPPTPMTLILAASIGVNELLQVQESSERCRFEGPLGGSLGEKHVLEANGERVFWLNPLKIEEEEEEHINSDGFVNWRVVINEW